MKRLSQNDHKWSRVKIGTSNLTIGGYGCLITCIAMAAGLTPDIVARRLQFTDNDYKYGGGLILWNDYNKDQLRNMGLDFVGRYRGWDKGDISTMKEMCQSEEFIPILNIQTKSGGGHWVLPVGRALTWRGLGWATNDPWDGSRQWKTVGAGAPYTRELGWLLFKRV